MEQDIPDYNMDSEDEVWVRKQAKTFDITPLKFEVMMDRLEKGSGQQVSIEGDNDLRRFQECCHNPTLLDIQLCLICDPLQDCVINNPNPDNGIS